MTSRTRTAAAVLAALAASCGSDPPASGPDVVHLDVLFFDAPVPEPDVAGDADADAAADAAPEDPCAEACATWEACGADVLHHCKASCALEGLETCELGCLAETSTCPEAIACLGIETTLRPWNPGPYGTAPKEIAGPFVLPTLRGAYSFFESWTGRASHVFVLLQTGHPYLQPLWDSLLEPLVWQGAPRQVHYFFLVYPEPDGTDAAAEHMAALQLRVDAVMEKVRAAFGRTEECHWRRRLHLVPVAVNTLSAWFAETLVDETPHAFAIDPLQRVREVGLLNLPMQPPQLQFLTFEVQGFEREVALEESLAASPATDIVLLDGEAGGDATFDRTLPTAAELEAFDTLEIDLDSACEGHRQANCHDWDSGASLAVLARPDEARNAAAETPCEPGSTLACTCSAPWQDEPLDAAQTCRADGSGYDPCDCGPPAVPQVEIGRWITTYKREGRWVHDVSPFLAALRRGGEVRFRWQPGQPYLTTLKLRFRNEGKPDRPSELRRLFQGGPFDAGYNAAHPPLTVDLPADLARVELVAHVTGHGFGVEAANCAEFCNHTHHWSLNGGAEHVLDHPAVGNTMGCALQVPDGTVPNQFGSWTFGRAGWCPGKHVTPFVADVTADAVAGGANTVHYRALLDGADYVPVPLDRGVGGFPAQIWLESWLVVYR